MLEQDTRVKRIQVDLKAHANMADAVDRDVEKRLLHLREVLLRCQSEIAALEAAVASGESGSTTGSTRTVACPDGSAEAVQDRVGGWRSSRRVNQPNSPTEPVLEMKVSPSVGAIPLQRSKDQQLRLLVEDPAQLKRAGDGAYSKLAIRVFVSIAVLVFFLMILLFLPV